MDEILYMFVSTKNIMNKRDYLKIIRLFSLFPFFFLIIQCASKTGEWRSKLLFVNEDVSKGRLLSGGSILLFPLITEKGFDTTASLSSEKQAKMLHAIRGKLKLYVKKEFEENYLSNNDRALLDSFYISLFANDLLKITASDSIWKSVPSRYILLIRVDKGIRINTFDGVLKRKAVLEGELWDAKNIEVVWRAQSSGYEMDDKVADAVFVAEGMKEIYRLLPEFLLDTKGKNW